jgi:hypothetical protein
VDPDWGLITIYDLRASVQHPLHETRMPPAPLWAGVLSATEETPAAAFKNFRPRDDPREVLFPVRQIPDPVLCGRQAAVAGLENTGEDRVVGMQPRGVFPRQLRLQVEPHLVVVGGLDGMARPKLPVDYARDRAVRLEIDDVAGAEGSRNS